ncbi:cupin domain-containing protein [Lachnotalea sp. AF33-28]|jgi:quercetin dioxygenase-like cupin family protein|uniref:cupin domain-containing protein n=1 Tax=Lachnotalea sp. AF33-28 TaxID=2292046 RepID=UPI000E517199|nr:cupin domain-containing protein [Lachnotalea sp. AF33-28]RHP36196.1 cupin domain-containing protein [Lachnotalea sp. AF33-28]
MFSFNQDITAKDLGGGVTRKVLTYSDNLMVCELTFQKGAVGALHSHPHEQVGYVISGSFEVEEEGQEKRILKAGDTYQIAPDVRHGVVALEDSLLLDVFNPMRKDFIE